MLRLLQECGSLEFGMSLGTAYSGDIRLPLEKMGG